MCSICQKISQNFVDTEAKSENQNLTLSHKTSSPSHCDWKILLPLSIKLPKALLCNSIRLGTSFFCQRPSTSHDKGGENTAWITQLKLTSLNCLHHNFKAIGQWTNKWLTPLLYTFMHQLGERQTFVLHP